MKRGSVKTVSMRVPPAKWDLFERAAQARGQTRTALVLEGAERMAEEALKERTHFSFSEAGWQDLLDALDAPVTQQERARVAALLSEKPVWEIRA